MYKQRELRQVNRATAFSLLRAELSGTRRELVWLYNRNFFGKKAQSVFTSNSSFKFASSQPALPDRLPFAFFHRLHSTSPFVTFRAKKKTKWESVFMCTNCISRQMHSGSSAKAFEQQSKAFIDMRGIFAPDYSMKMKPNRLGIDWEGKIRILFSSL